MSTYQVEMLVKRWEDMLWLNYTQDQVEYIVNQYRLNPDRETVEKLADELNKSVKSIIGKLSREGVIKRLNILRKQAKNQ